jgi:uncharacterized repeat protein (TIGR01451 family)
MNNQLLTIVRFLCRSSFQVAIATGLLSILHIRAAQAVPIDCSTIYFTDSGNFVNPNIPGGLYSVNTNTGATTLVGQFPNSITTPATWTNRAGGVVSIIGGTTPTAYASSDTFAQPGANLQSFDGTTATNLPNATFPIAANGMAAAPNGALMFITNNSGTQKIYQFTNTNSPAQFVGNITAPPGDTIFNRLSAGDNAFDGNGRHYYFASVNGSGGTGYLYYIDPALQAHYLGSIPTPSGATGLAFDAAGNLYTSARNILYKVTITNGAVGNTVIIGQSAQTIIDMGSCASPTNINPLFNVNDGIVKQVRNVTTGETFTDRDKAKVGDILEYQLTIQNSGNLPSDTTKFSDLIPAGTTYVQNSTYLYDSTGTGTTAHPAVLIADLTSGAAPFTAPAIGTNPATAAGMLVNTYGESAGTVNMGATNAVVVKFRVTVTASTGIIPNTATLTYPAANFGSFTTASQTSNLVNTTLSVKLTGTVWNDLDLSGKTSTIFTTGESGTNTGSSSFYAYLLDPTGNIVIASSPISADGTYSFPTVLPSQTELSIELSTTPPTSPLASMTVPVPSLPTDWKKTTPLTILSVSTALADVPNKDFGIVHGANVILVKRITAIQDGLTKTWSRTNNPNDNTSLNPIAPVHNPLDTANNDKNPNWPTNYLLGASSAGMVKPGDGIEYTIYYLNAQGASASSLKICDPIRGGQTYKLGSMQLFPAGVTTASVLTDPIDTADRAYAYGVATTANNPGPTDCNITATTAAGIDRGGVAVQITGSGAASQPDLLTLPGAISAGNPANSYGAFKFTTVVDP